MIKDELEEKERLLKLCEEEKEKVCNEMIIVYNLVCIL